MVKERVDAVAESIVLPVAEQGELMNRAAKGFVGVPEEGHDQGFLRKYIALAGLARHQSAMC